MAKWIKTTFPGVRYREHPTRKNGVRKDQYFTIRYKLNCKDKEEGLGWASEDWTSAKAYERLVELKQNIKDAKGPQSLKEKREREQEKREQEKADQGRREKEAVTFGQFFKDTYLPQAKADKKTRTAQREEGLFKLWISPVIGHFPMKDVTPFHLEIIKNNMAKKVMKEVEQSAGIKIMKEVKQSPRSIEYALALIRQVFNTARRLRIYDGESPTANVKSPKVDNARMRFLTLEEAEALLNALKAKSQDVYDMTLLSLHVGLRFGEIASLTGQDVDLDKEMLMIRDAKAGSRYAFLTDQAVEMLKNRPQGKPSDYVFPGRKGKMDRISPTFFRIVDDLKFNEGIDDPRLKICFHSCRHSYASWMIEQGQDLYTVQKLLGHKTNVMTQRYAHMTENKMKNAAKALSYALQTGKNAGEDQTEQVVNFSK
jgi:integrase